MDILLQFVGDMTSAIVDVVGKDKDGNFNIVGIAGVMFCVVIMIVMTVGCVKSWW